MEYAYLNKETVCDNIRNLSQLTFEVTDACNLKCKYCGYGELYSGYDYRENKILSTQVAFRVLEYLHAQWQYSDSFHKKTYISFYGGEPLLNMNFICEIVDWVKNHPIPQCDFVFIMTTNGILLDRYIDYLMKWDFQILVSLDGNEINSGYRVDHAGKSSFSRTYNNVKSIQNNYPDFFRQNINFNSVLHNLNSYQDIITFFQNDFGKNPSISELSMSGVKEDRKIEIKEMYNEKWESLNKASNKEKMKDILFMDNPETSVLCTYLHAHSGNVYSSYIDLLTNQTIKKWYPTGTCLPFGKKMFVTVNGKILPCERIMQNYALGYVDEKNVVINIDNIVSTYNQYFSKYIPQCSTCYNNNTCKQCMFHNANLKGKAKCVAFMGKKDFKDYQNDQYSYLSEHPNLYKKIMTEVIIH